MVFENTENHPEVKVYSTVTATVRPAVLGQVPVQSTAAAVVQATVGTVIDDDNIVAAARTAVVTEAVPVEDERQAARAPAAAACDIITRVAMKRPASMIPNRIMTRIGNTSAVSTVSDPRWRRSRARQTNGNCTPAV